MNNKLRIIAGYWRSRQIIFDDAEGLRPTASKIRETLFNWLQNDVIASHCLDLYAGSGALSFEAASRGATKVLQVEQNPNVCRQLKNNADNLAATQIKLVKNEVFDFLSLTKPQPFDLVFIDPPFNKNLAIKSCQWLENKNWLALNAKIYLEVEHQLVLQGMPENWQCLKNKSAGEVDYYLFQRT